MIVLILKFEHFNFGFVSNLVFRALDLNRTGHPCPPLRSLTASTCHYDRKNGGSPVILISVESYYGLHYNKE
jgi:hypothetical protein